MRAVVCERLGDPLSPPPGAPGAALCVHDSWPAPSASNPAGPPPGHVRVRISAASLNFADLLQVAGLYQDRPKLPFVVGSDFAGVVVAAGATGVPAEIATPGTRVCGVAANQAFAEEADVPAAGVWRVPDALTDLPSAAALPVAYGTADLALRHRARLQQGQTLLVLGASGGVGAAAVQLGVLAGATVVAVARGEDKARFCREQLGAHAVVDTAAVAAAAAASSSSEAAGSGNKGGGGDNRALAAAFKAALARAVAATTGQQQQKRRPHPPTADVIFDNVGGDQFSAALRAASWGAQLLAVGFASGAIPRVPSNVLLVKNATLHGVFWGAHLSNPAAGPEAARLLRQGVARVLGLVAEGKITVQASARLPLQRVGEAMGLMRGRKAQGKVLLLIGKEERHQQQQATDEAGTGALVGGPPPYPRSRL
jgi:NADPH:quinone reductase